MKKLNYIKYVLCNVWFLYNIQIQLLLKQLLNAKKHLHKFYSIQRQETFVSFTQDAGNLVHHKDEIFVSIQTGHSKIFYLYHFFYFKFFFSFSLSVAVDLINTLVNVIYLERFPNSLHDIFFHLIFDTRFACHTVNFLGISPSIIKSQIFFLLTLFFSYTSLLPIYSLVFFFLPNSCYCI